MKSCARCGPRMHELTTASGAASSRLGTDMARELFPRPMCQILLQVQYLSLADNIELI